MIAHLLALTLAVTATDTLVGDTLGVPMPDAESLEGVFVQGMRGGFAAPVTQTTLTRGTLMRARGVREITDILERAPAVTAASDAGTPFGYAYYRLRGMDQTRIQTTLDGIPLNEPEDQGAYFSNFPDFAGSVHSAQIQRGVGLSGLGTASYAGAVHLQTEALRSISSGGELAADAGAFGTRRLSGRTTHRTGAWAVDARLSHSTTDGFREHGGSEGHLAQLRLGHITARHETTLGLLRGHSENDMVYLAAAEADLATNPRTNYLSPEETDRFGQQIVSLSHTHRLGSAWSLTGAVYRNDLAGDYDVDLGPEDGLWNFQLDGGWTGAMAGVRYEQLGWDISAGVHFFRYSRDHAAAIHPDTHGLLYHNTGERGEESVFLKVGRHLGPATLLADLELRQTRFSYRPDAADGFPVPDMEWRFANPRIGASVQVVEPLQFYAFIGRTSREPTRSDLFGGFDNVGPFEADFLGGFEGGARIRPEVVRNLEAGARWRAGVLSASANLFWMDFRDEIMPIGKLSYIGLPLRRNVDRSYRRGAEAEIAWDLPAAPLAVGGSLAWLDARIKAFEDDETGRLHRNVRPLLSPAWTGTAWGEARGNDWTLIGEINGAAESQLDNTGDPGLTLPGHLYGNVTVERMFGGHKGYLQINNVTDATVYSSGYAVGVERHFFPLAGRHLMAGMRLRF